MVIDHPYIAAVPYRTISFLLRRQTVAGAILKTVNSAFGSYCHALLANVNTPLTNSSFLTSGSLGAVLLNTVRGGRITSAPGSSARFAHGRTQGRIWHRAFLSERWTKEKGRCCEKAFFKEGPGGKYLRISCSFRATLWVSHYTADLSLPTAVLDGGRRLSWKKAVRRLVSKETDRHATWMVVIKSM